MPELPTGTVTFLFTDIEGSTRMWERHPEAMSAALARHDTILRRAIEDHEGLVFKTVGDAFCAALPSAPGALEAALGSQRALLSEEWPEETGPLRVRMALHTGEVEERGGDYFGPPVNRVARLLSAGHGGQTLLSLAAQELVRDALPLGTELRNMGERHLKDLSRPETVFQLCAPDLPSSFPPLRTLDARRNNLPPQPAPLVGREREVGEVAATLRRGVARLLTLTGPGGAGKTRLALQAAADLLDEFEGGAFFVPLAAVTDPELFFSEVAGALVLRTVGEASLPAVVKEYLGRRELLLVLDNFEQLLAAAPLVGELLSVAPGLRVLATSRVTLGVYGEREYVVPPLSVPDPGRASSFADLSGYEAVRLFVERAQAARKGFALTEENATDVARICARLDGLPLAIELAAARVKVLPPKAMLKRLSDRLGLLTGGARDLPARQRTLRGAIDWSFDLLRKEEQILFRRLSVFAGGRTLEAIEAVCDAEGDLPVDALEGVSSLLDKSLLRREEGPDGESRFVMLETIHEYAREKLEGSGEAGQMGRAHARYFLSLAQEAEPELVGPEQVEWMDRLEAEHDNFRAALAWCAERGEGTMALRLAASLSWFWNVRGHFNEGCGWCEEALAASEAAAPAERARVMLEAGMLASMQCDFEGAARRLEKGLSLCRDSGDRTQEVRALCYLGLNTLAAEQDLERASKQLAGAVRMSRECGSSWDLACALTVLGIVRSAQGDYALSRIATAEALEIARAEGYLHVRAAATGNLGIDALLHGDYERARVLLQDGRRLFEVLKDRHNRATMLHNLGLLALVRGCLDEAAALSQECLRMRADLLDDVGVACDLDVLSAVCAEQGDVTGATRLWGAAEALRRVVGAVRPRDEALLLEPFIHAARSRLEETSWETAWSEGAAMSRDEAIAYASGEGAGTRVAEHP